MQSLVVYNFRATFNNVPPVKHSKQRVLKNWVTDCRYAFMWRCPCSLECHARPKSTGIRQAAFKLGESFWQPPLWCETKDAPRRTPVLILRPGQKISVQGDQPIGNNDFYNPVHCLQRDLLLCITCYGFNCPTLAKRRAQPLTTTPGRVAQSTDERQRRPVAEGLLLARLARRRGLVLGLNNLNRITLEEIFNIAIPNSNLWRCSKCQAS